MSWQEIYKSRLMTAQEAAKIVKSGDCMWTPLLLGQPAMLIMDAIADRKDELKDVEYLNCLTLRPYKIFKPEYRDTFTLVFGFLQHPAPAGTGQKRMGQFLARPKLRRGHQIRPPETGLQPPHGHHHAGDAARRTRFCESGA